MANSGHKIKQQKMVTYFEIVKKVELKGCSVTRCCCLVCGVVWLTELAGDYKQVLVLESVHRGALAKVVIVDLIEE